MTINPSRRRTALRALCGLTVLATVAAACGGDDDDATSDTDAATETTAGAPATTAAAPATTAASAATDAPPDTAGPATTEASATETTAAGGLDAAEIDALLAPEDLVAAAQEEGELVFYAGAHTEEALQLAIESFEEAYGIPVTAVEETSSATVQKVETELRSGNPVADALSLSDDASLARWAEDGTTASIDFPITDSLFEGIYDGESPHVPYSLNAMGLMYNTSTLDPSLVPQTWEDLLELPDDVVIAVTNPTTSGTARGWASVMWELYGEEYFAQLGEKNLLLIDSSTAVPALVITGEADIGIPGTARGVMQPKEDGEPVEFAILEGPVPSAVSSVAALASAPHPNAAKLFVNHHFSTVFTEGFNDFGSTSTRADIPSVTGTDVRELDLYLGDPALFTDEQAQTVFEYLQP